MHVETPPDILDTAARLGAGVPYALKVLAGQLADDPEMGRPSASARHSVRDGRRRHVRGLPRPDHWLHSRARPDPDPIRASRSPPPAPPQRPRQGTEGSLILPPTRSPQAKSAMPGTASPAGSSTTPPLRSCAPCRRGRTRRRCPGAGSRSGGTPDLRALWSLTAGDDGVDGAGCLPGNQALMPLGAVTAVYRQQMDSPSAPGRPQRPPAGIRPDYRVEVFLDSGGLLWRD